MRNNEFYLMKSILSRSPSPSFVGSSLPEGAYLIVRFHICVYLHKFEFSGGKRDTCQSLPLEGKVAAVG